MPNELLERALSAYGRAVRIADPLRFQLWSDRGLTMPQVRVLFELVENGDRAAGELAEALTVAPPTITGLTDRLVKQGLVERSEDPRDRRVVRLGLTEDGRALTIEIAEKSRAYLIELFEHIPPERLDDICAALEELADANTRWRGAREAVPS
ncbi:MAG: MarR family transcriptional regulator [Chloroflexota bacterium]